MRKSWVLPGCHTKPNLTGNLIERRLSRGTTPGFPGTGGHGTTGQAGVSGGKEKGKGTTAGDPHQGHPRHPDRNLRAKGNG